MHFMKRKSQADLNTVLCIEGKIKQNIVEKIKTNYLNLFFFFKSYKNMLVFLLFLFKEDEKVISIKLMIIFCFVES